MSLCRSNIFLLTLGTGNQPPTIPMFSGNLVEPADNFMLLGSMQLCILCSIHY